MAEFFLELFCEEIPARMQARAADDLSRLLTEGLAPLTPVQPRVFYGPRRLAFAADVSDGTPEAKTSERGPRANAPEQALAGFLRKHNATREDVRQEGDYWVLEKTAPAVSAATLVAEAMPNLLRCLPWPKSMRWGGTSAFTWVRPLRRIVCLLDGAVVPFSLRDGADDGHGLASSNITEGHRFHAPTPITVTSYAQWRHALREARVVVDVEERKHLIGAGIARLAAEKGLNVVDDAGLLEEVAGLVEWPVPLLGRIDAAYMDLPAEVMQVSMRVNQRYFALRNSDGSAAPYFAFVANVEATDGGATIIAGNERVLRARFADARHFWDLDRKARLESLVDRLDHVTFHARLGSQGERVRRLESLAAHIAPLVGAAPDVARAAARLCKADLLTGMVGEFPELQGVMGRYYALHDGENAPIADAVRDHYAPKGPSDVVPTEPVSVAVALADKIDQLLSFFEINEKPTGSGDPYALRRAALGIIRIVTENGLRFSMLSFLQQCDAVRTNTMGQRAQNATLYRDVYEFLLDRLVVMLRTQGARHDVLRGVISDARQDFTDLIRRTNAIASFLATREGSDLLAGYKRGANILRIEDQKDGPHTGPVHRDLLSLDEERRVMTELEEKEPLIRVQMATDASYPDAMSTLASLRGPVDMFFDKVTVNAKEPELRRNRLALLNRLRATMDQVADFSKIEG